MNAGGFPGANGALVPVHGELTARDFNSALRSGAGKLEAQAAPSRANENGKQHGNSANPGMSQAAAHERMIPTEHL
jgi:hypothetical protein